MSTSNYFEICCKSTLILAENLNFFSKHFSVYIFLNPTVSSIWEYISKLEFELQTNTITKRILTLVFGNQFRGWSWATIKTPFLSTAASPQPVDQPLWMFSQRLPENGLYNNDAWVLTFCQDRARIKKRIACVNCQMIISLKMGLGAAFLTRGSRCNLTLVIILTK